MQRQWSRVACGLLGWAVAACSGSDGGSAAMPAVNASAASNPAAAAPVVQAPASSGTAPGAAAGGGAMPVAAMPGSSGAPAAVAGSGAQVASPALGNGQAGSGAAMPGGVSAAGDPDAFNPYPDFKSEVYADDKMWACKPGLANNPCLDQLDATEVLADGTTKPAPEDVSAPHAVDCLYWYPTVDRPVAQTSRDFSNSTSIDGVVRSQVARFSRVCNVYVPYYRLVGLSGSDDIELAYQDVLESFKYFIANLSEGRDFVLLGHSQGSNHGLRLLKEEFDDSPELIKRMVSALMIGYPVQLPQGQAMGGTFKNIPICQSAEQTGCLINFMSYSADNPPASGGGGGSNAQFGAVEVCTNPAALAGGPALLQGTYFRAQGSPVASSVTTTWALYRDFFRAECKRTSGGTAYLEISLANQPGDQRMNFFDFNNVTGASLGIGLHVMDYTFSQGDMIDMVSAQIGARP